MSGICHIIALVANDGVSLPKWACREKRAQQPTQFSRWPAAVGALYVSSAAFLWQSTVCYSGIKTIVQRDALVACIAMLQ